MKERIPFKQEKESLKNLGRIIEGHFKKGLQKVEEIQRAVARSTEFHRERFWNSVFKDTRAADDKLFSYLKVFMDDKGVAAVTPSSKYLVDRVLKAMDVKQAGLIIEYGAADGVMTRKILEKMPRDAKLLAIELNEKFYSALSRIVEPRFIAHQGDVRGVAAIAKKYGLGSADVIVSGIPFAFLSGAGRHDLLADTARLLKPGGRFVGYQVTTHLIHPLHAHFKKVKTEFEIRNIPPHFVFTAFK